MAGVVAASDCPRSPGFWKTHDWDEVLVDPARPQLGSIEDALKASDDYDSGLYILGGVEKTLDEWQAFLGEPARGDKSVILAQQLLATRLNFLRRKRDDADCVDNPAPDFGSYSTFRDVKRAAERWLNASNFSTSASQRGWTVGGVDGEELKDSLDDFNNQRIAELDCDCS